MFLLIFFVSFARRWRNLLFFWFFNFHNVDCSFLWIKTIKFIVIFFVTIVTNNIFKSSDFISFSFSFNIIAYFALIINVNFALIKKLRIELIVKFIRKSFWFVEKIFEKFELNRIIFVICARAFQNFYLHNNFNHNFFLSIKYFIDI